MTTTETPTDPSPEAVQQTLAEYERLAISTGATVQIDPPEFSIDGVAWTPVGVGVPQFARATVYRDGIPTTVYVSWDESVPQDVGWLALWLRKPMKLFGAYTIRAALRRAFRDVIGDRREPDEREVTAIAAPETTTVKRDWRSELDAAETVDQVQALHRDAKAARAVTVELETLIRLRLRVVAEAAVEAHGVVTLPAKSRPKPSPPTIRPEDTVRKPRAKGGKR